MVIDFHTHTFPEKIVNKAINILASSSGNMEVFGDGTVESLISKLDEGGVDKGVVLNIATNEKQMKSVNNFAISINGYKERLISFGSVYPTAANAIEELYRLHENGIKGVKFHPEYQDFYIDDDRMAGIYETISKLGLITVFHAGMDNGFPFPAHASPERSARALGAFTAPVVLAHMGGYIMWEDVYNHLAGKTVFFDTSFCFSRIPLPICKAIIEKHGIDKILFGSDLPWSDPASERRLINALSLSPEDEALILGENASRILNIG